MSGVKETMALASDAIKQAPELKSQQVRPGSSFQICAKDLQVLYDRIWTQLKKQPHRWKRNEAFSLPGVPSPEGDIEHALMIVDKALVCCFSRRRKNDRFPRTLLTRVPSTRAAQIHGTATSWDHGSRNWNS